MRLIPVIERAAGPTDPFNRDERNPIMGVVEFPPAIIEQQFRRHHGMTCLYNNVVWVADGRLRWADGSGYINPRDEPYLIHRHNGWVHSVRRGQLDDVLAAIGYERA